MAPIVSSVEIARRPEDVFSYVSDPSRLAEWQESVVSAHVEGGGPPAVGSKAITTRRIGRGERTMTMELTEITAPRSWAVRGIDGPVRGIVNGTVEPLDDGARSRVTIELDFEGHGIGKLLVPVLVRPQAKQELPKNAQNLKERLEGSPT
ncbi:MAG: SRPBCC family protein [Actinomycetota bacterium]|nr:SRPBCC family protein [Actinomycetota bacterium]